MELNAPIHGFAVASCSNEKIAPRGLRIRTLQLPCNFCRHSISCTSKASHGHCHIVARNGLQKEAVRSIAPFPTHKPLINHINADSYQQSSFSERWIEDSICDIVKHINEAPFLQLLFDSGDDSTTMTSQSQRMPVGNWYTADEKWNEMKGQVTRASPDGIILVHHLQGNSCEGCIVGDELGMDTTTRDANAYAIDKRSDGKDLWGVLILGRALAKSACYVLETTNVSSPFGSCTSFCLTKAQSFGSSWHEQIQSSWLLKTEI